MIKASYSDKSIVVDILSESFDANKSVNDVVRQDEQRLKRIRNLMGYSFELCYKFGDILLSEDKKGCMLVLYPEKKKITWKAVWLDLNLAVTCIGLSKIRRVLERESKIKIHHPTTGVYHLWFIGVKPIAQKKGIGSLLMDFAIKESIRQQRTIFLETSTLANLPWYQKFGFEIIHELDLGYSLFMLKKNNPETQKKMYV